MHSGTARIIVAIVLLGALSLGTIRNALALAAAVSSGSFDAFAAGTAVGALVPLLGAIGSIVLLRSGLRRRRAAGEAHPTPEAPLDAAADRYELAREYPAERWTSLPLDEERLAAWLTSRACAEEDGSAVTAEGLRRSDESDRGGTVRTLEHRYGYVRITLLSSFSRLRGLTIELLVEDPGIRAEIIADLHALAEDLGGLTLRAAVPGSEQQRFAATA